MKDCKFKKVQRYNKSMFRPIFLILFVSLMPAFASRVWAQAYASPSSTDTADEGVTGGFAKPYEYERKAYGYDPEGVQYKENQAEDFQVVFITSLPFTAGASFLITSTVSLATTNNFGVGGDFFLPFLAATFVGSTTIACISTLTNKYPPPTSPFYSENPVPDRTLALKVPLIMAKF